MLPDKIAISRGPLVRLYAHDPERLRREVGRVVLNEVACHFGISDERLIEINVTETEDERRRNAAMQDDLVGRAADVVAAAGDRATAFVIFGSIVIPLAILTAVCWFFWKHRHDD